MRHRPPIFGMIVDLMRGQWGLAMVVGAVACRQPNPDWQGSPVEGTTDAAQSDSAASTSVTETTASATDGGSGGAGLGLACTQDLDCSDVPGGECCTAKPCKDTCTVPCSDVADCPTPDMGCEHGYCLLPCNDDADCVAWPGYSCQHGGSFCEKD